MAQQQVPIIGKGFSMLEYIFTKSGVQKTQPEKDNSGHNPSRPFPTQPKASYTTSAETNTVDSVLESQNLSDLDNDECSEDSSVDTKVTNQSKLHLALFSFILTLFSHI
jgi:hypothetical protein